MAVAMTVANAAYVCAAEPLMDVLDDILNSLRLRGGVVVDGEFSGDFCVPAEFTVYPRR